MVLAAVLLLLLVLVLVARGAGVLLRRGLAMVLGGRPQDGPAQAP